MREKVEALKALWTQDEASYQGKFVSFDRVWSSPKPVQKPHPPILAGFHSENGLKRVVKYCDGWMPLYNVVDDIPKAFADLRQQMEAAGRDPASLRLSVWTTPGVNPDEAKLEKLRLAGVERVVLFAQVAGRDKVLPFLDQYAKLIPQMAGARAAA